MKTGLIAEARLAAYRTETKDAHSADIGPALGRMIAGAKDITGTLRGLGYCIYQFMDGSVIYDSGSGYRDNWKISDMLDDTGWPVAVLDITDAERAELCRKGYPYCKTPDGGWTADQLDDFI
jgi:hypothetical protein